MGDLGKEVKEPKNNQDGLSTQNSKPRRGRRDAALPSGRRDLAQCKGKTPPAGRSLV